MEPTTTRIFAQAVQHAEQIPTSRNSERSVDNTSYLNMRLLELDGLAYRLTPLHYHFALLTLAIAKRNRFSPSPSQELLSEAQMIINTYPPNSITIEDHLQLSPPNLAEMPSLSDLAVQLARVILIEKYPDKYIPRLISKRMTDWCTVN